MHVSNDDLAVICLGFGRSAALYVGATPENTPAVILSGTNIMGNKIDGVRGTREFSQARTAEDIAGFAKQNKDRQLLIIITTTPSRGHELLHNIRPVLDDLKKQGIRPVFFLPQSPNPYFRQASAYGPVVLADYYMGIGGMKFEPETGTYHVKAGLKENFVYTVIGDEKPAKAILPVISLGRTAHKEKTPLQLALLPTNAILHTVGILAHLAERINGDMSGIESMAELDGRLPKDINASSGLHGHGKLLGERGFYREMPRTAAKLMHEISTCVSNIRKRMITAGYLEPTEMDRFDSFIEPHLVFKYRLQYFHKHGKDAADIDFGEFINNNPPYQNPMILFPVKPDGTINTEHRFFTEELPTMAMLYKLGKCLGMSETELEPIELVTKLNQQLGKKEYLTHTNELGRDAPQYLQGLTSPAAFSRYYDHAALGR